MPDDTQSQDSPADLVSTVPSVPADLTLNPDPPVATASAESNPIPADPIATPAVDIPLPPADSPIEASSSAEVVTPAEPPSSPPADPTPTTSEDVQPPVPQAPESPQIPEAQAPIVSPASSPPEATSGGSIQDSLPSNQPIQEPSEAPENIPSPQVSPVPENPPQSAEIKPEPPQGTQNTPSADLPIEASAKLGVNAPKSSFGDILYGTGRPDVPSTPPVIAQAPAPMPSPVIPVPAAPTPSSTVPKTTFGDLSGKPPVEEPAIHIDPIEPPKTVTPPPQSPQTPQSPQPDLSFSRRQKSALVRKQKHDANIAKVLELLGTKKNIKNSDVRDYLHVSQTTATDYLHTLVSSGRIKKAGKAKATTYSL